jgi:hypothetical protein
MWNIIWEIVIFFSLISFTFMSFRILYKGIGELADMFKNLDDKYQSL